MKILGMASLHQRPAEAPYPLLTRSSLVYAVPSATGPLGSAKGLLLFDLGVQVGVHDILGDLVRVFDLKLLVHREPSFSASNLQHRPLHKRVHHPVLDGLSARGGGARVEEQQRAALAAGMLVCVAVKGKARFG